MRKVINFYKLIIAVILIISIFAAILLFSIKYHVRQKVQSLNKINRLIYEAELEMHVLKAEYAYLSNPSRISEIADERLDLRLIKEKDVFYIDDMCE